MKKISSILRAIGIGALLGVSCTFAYTTEQKEAYQWAYQHKITTQPTIEAANLYGQVTRQELAKMLTNYIENIAGGMEATTSSCTFTDEDKITNNLKPYTRKICAYKIMGSNGKAFKPTDKVTRAELGTTISRMLWGDRYNVSGKDYYIYHLNALKDQGIMNNIKDPTKSFAKRGDTFIMLKRLYDKYYSSEIHIDTSTIGEDYISNLYANANVVYETKDGKKYYYDGDFLTILKKLADIKGESDLKNYLAIEAEYYKDGLSQVAGLDDDKISEMLGIDLSEVDVDSMSDKEKQQLIKQIKDAIDSLLNKNETRNEKYLNSLENAVKKIGDDKFGLKDKYQKTKTFVEKTNSFLREYLGKMYDVLDLSLKGEELNDEEGIALAFGLLGDLMSYNVTAATYQEYIEDWARNTMDALNKIKSTKQNNTTTTNTQQNETSNTTDNNNTKTYNKIQKIVEDMIANAPIRGNKNARFTIIEYTDLLCPFCARHSQDGTINTVIRELSGEVNSVSRHYLVHADALELAAAVECVAELKPSVYYTTLEKAFEAYPVDLEGITNIATELGVNKSQLQSCIKKGKYTKAVKNMMDQGEKTFGVHGTPGNVIIDRETGDYELVPGAYPAEVFVEVINEMKKAK